MHDREESSEVRVPVYSNGEQRGEESLPVVVVGPERYRLLASPGFVEGLAAGDEFELAADAPQGYRVLARGGNLCIWFYFHKEVDAVSPAAADLSRTVGALSGRLDGGWSRMLVLTVPLTAGWATIEASMNAAVARLGAASWQYGNVYDSADGITPLRWWEHER